MWEHGAGGRGGEKERRHEMRTVIMRAVERTHLQVELPGEQSSAIHGNVDVAVCATRDGIGVQHVVTLAYGRPGHETQVVLRSADKMIKHR